MTTDHRPAPVSAMPRIAAVIPCFNEALAITQVIEGFRAALPGAEIHVFDNNSTDDTAAVARAAGAIVTHVAARGRTWPRAARATWCGACSPTSRPTST